MTEHSCRVIGCEAPAESQGLCAMHFTRALIYGQVRLAETQTRSAGAPKPAVAQ